MTCLTSAKYSMLADIIKPQDSPDVSGGHWTYEQNPDSGAIVRTWVMDDQSTDDIEGKEIKSVKCLAKSALGPSLRNIEQFGDQYTNNDWITISVSFRTNVTLRDKITNIRNLKGVIIWTEEESDGNPPTVFDVYQITPLIDGFGNAIEKVILAKRAGVQQS